MKSCTILSQTYEFYSRRMQRTLLKVSISKTDEIRFTIKTGDSITLGRQHWLEIIWLCVKLV